MATIDGGGRPAFYERDAAAIVERIMPLLQPNDVVTVFSNGGFDGIHEKLLARCGVVAELRRAPAEQLVLAEDISRPGCEITMCDRAQSASLLAACERGA